MSCWDIVVWEGDNSISAVPSSWKVKDGLYLWPKSMKSQKLYRLISDCTRPSANIEYHELNAACKKQVTNYKKADKYIKKLETQSSIESNSDVCESGNDRSSGFEKPSTSTITTFTRNVESLGLESLDLNLTPSTHDSTLKAQPEIQSERTQQRNKKISSHEVAILVKMAAKQDFEIKEIKCTQNEILRKLNRIEQFLINKPKVSEKKSNIVLPIKSLDDMKKVEEQLVDCSEINNLAEEISLVGGSSLRNYITNLVKKVFSKEVATKYSARGRKQKLDFSKTKLCSVIIKSAQIRYQEATETDVIKFIGLSLATCGDWFGGAKERLSLKNATKTNSVSINNETSNDMNEGGYMLEQDDA